MPPSSAARLTETQAIELYEATRAMRHLQRRWFSGDKSAATMVASKRAEKRVDELLDEVEGRQGRLL